MGGLEPALILGPIGLIGVAANAVVALRRERTAHLEARDPPPTELLERPERDGRQALE